ncbi:MAG: 23S rRNA (uracil(1939)-C(5))-methyltransferase RlmD [Dissulfurispiraceae bacterium]
MRKDDHPIILDVDSPAYGGISIGRWGSKIVFVKGALPSETVEVKIEAEKKDYYIASVVQIHKASPYRISPTCQYFTSCGGCHLQYLSYGQQISLKEAVLADCLKRIASIDIPISPSIFSNSPWGYRRRGQFKVSFTGIGFHREKTREIIPIYGCPLVVDEINACLGKLGSMMEDFPKLFHGITEIQLTCGDGVIGLIKTKNGQIHDMPLLRELLPKSGLAGAVVQQKDSYKMCYGRRNITLALHNLRYVVSPMTFFQSHWALNQIVVQLVKDSLQPLKGLRILDLYAGAGNFSLPLASDAEEVIAVEENAYAIDDAMRNAKINSIKNCRFIRSSAEHLVPASPVNIVIVDPPRAGLTKKAIDTICDLMPERIVYLSCHPATFARDLKRFLVTYDIESVRMIDFFSQTYHIEAIAFLRAK